MSFSHQQDHPPKVFMSLAYMYTTVFDIFGALECPHSAVSFGTTLPQLHNVRMRLCEGTQMEMAV